MRWQDQSETIALPAYDALLARLGVDERQRLQDTNSELPRVVISAACWRAMRDDVDQSSEERGGLLLGRAYGRAGSVLVAGGLESAAQGGGPT